MKKKIELLAPAGNLEKMKYAIAYGADAVYLGVPEYSLRARINKFNEKTLGEGIKFAHERKKKVYITLNIYAHNRHLLPIEKHLKFLRKLSIDGVIVSDPGIINLVKHYLPKVEIHLSTQANATNWQAVKFWRDLGVKRVILAREVTLSEIKEIRKKVKNIELEYFVHGAMCMSYSGRCILSKWMTGRSANLGDCAQPCRWKYNETKNISIVDDQKRYEMDIEEDKHGTYFFNSYDMNLIEYIDDLIDAGITSLKIEGRAKSVYYVAVVCRAYRKVIDAMHLGSKSLSPSLSPKRLLEPGVKKIIREQKKELDKLTNRGYSTGFLLGAEPPHDFSDRKRKADFSFVGEVLGEKDGMNVVRVHNTMHKKDKIEVITPQGNIPAKIKEIKNQEGRKVAEAHGGTDKNYYIKFDKTLEKRNIIRKIS
jgi:putative protease